MPGVCFLRFLHIDTYKLNPFLSNSHEPTDKDLGLANAWPLPTVPQGVHPCAYLLVYVCESFQK